MTLTPVKPPPHYHDRFWHVAYETRIYLWLASEWPRALMEEGLAGYRNIARFIP